MARGARTVHQKRSASLVVKLDVEVAAEADRLARAARMTRDAYVTLALRHYNRFHALTKRQRVRSGRNRRVVLLFPASPPAKLTPAPSTPKSRRRRNER